MTIRTATCVAFASTLLLLNGIDQNLLASTDGFEQVKVSFVPSSPTFSLHEPLIVEVRIENGGTEAVMRDLGSNFKTNYLVTVTTPDGMTTPPLRLRVSGFAIAGKVSIGAGDQHVGKLVLNEWYDFNRVGTYTIGIELTNGPGPDAVRGPDVESSTTGTIEVQITPRDEVRLRAVCQRLATDVESATTVQPAFDAARALSYVVDPIAVPYIRAVLSMTTLVDPIVLEGLVRIGNEEARQVLASATREPGERAAQAMGALARLAKPSGPEVR